MATDLRFPSYVGAMLVNALPFRKKNLLFGPQVCERAAVIPTEKSAFLVGCALVFWSKFDAVNAGLDGVTAPETWKDTHGAIVDQLNERASRLTVNEASYETVFPEAAFPADRPDARLLMTRPECVDALAHRVMLGIFWGVLHPELGRAVLEAWLSQSGGWLNLGVGGVSVDASTRMETVEESIEAAHMVFYEWVNWHNAHFPD